MQRLSRPGWPRVAVVLLVVLGAAALAYAYVESGKERFEPGVARMDAYSIGSAPNELTLYFSTGAGDRVNEPVLTEELGRVLVTVRTSVYIPARGAFKDLAARLQRMTVTLNEPLGDRTVVDATTGHDLARRPPQP